ncbi:MAG: phosphopantothenoylcysteine decarboxylase [Candidatus Brocadiia bacterium]
MMKILVTAGPTREYFDRVRYISNPSTGRMGFEIAAAAKARGHEVTLVTGPTHLESPKGVLVQRVTTAREMLARVNKYFPKSDAVIMTAAVSDYRPAQYHNGKIKKTGKATSVRLKPTPDILRTISRRKGDKILVGFALEASHLSRNAMRKLKDKNLDFVVANGPDSFGPGRVSAEIWSPLGLVKRFRNANKKEIGRFIIKLLENI